MNQRYRTLPCKCGAPPGTCSAQEGPSHYLVEPEEEKSISEWYRLTIKAVGDIESQDCNQSFTLTDWSTLVKEVLHELVNSK